MLVMQILKRAINNFTLIDEQSEQSYSAEERVMRHIPRHGIAGSGPAPDYF